MCLYSDRELLENSIAPKQQRLSSSDLAQLVELLILKDAELKETIQVSTCAHYKLYMVINAKHNLYIYIYIYFFFSFFSIWCGE